MLENLFTVFRSARLLDMRNDRFDLIRRDKAALHAGGLAAAERRIQHIALADQLFRAGCVQNDAGLDLAGHRKRDAGRDVRLHNAGDDVRRRALRRNDQMHARRARLLRDAADRGLDLFGCDHHQVCQLVDDNHDLRQYLILFRAAALLLFSLGLFRAHQVVISGEVAHLMVGKQLIAPLHFTHRPVERTGRLFRVGDDRDQQMRDAVVVAQFDHLGVDHDQADLLRRGLIQNGDQHGVDAHGFARAGRTGDQQMRHLGNVADDRLAGDVLAHGKGQAAACTRKRGRRDALADVDRIDRFIRHLNADRDLIRDGRNAHADCAEGQRNIVRQGGDARQLDAARNGQFEPRDRRTAHDADDLCVNVKRLERVDQTLGILLELGFRARV